MAPKKSVSSEDPRKKRLKSKASRDEPPSLDKSFASSEYSVRFHDDISRWHMETCVKKKNGALPYGLHITTILNHFGVDFSGEKETRDVTHTDVYGETTMKQMRYEFKDDTWVKKNVPVMEQVGEEAQMDEAEAEAAGNEEPMQEDQEPRSAPSSSSRVNEDNFQLVLGRLDSLATSMGNIQTSIGNMQTSIDNFSTMVTKRFSTYDEHFGTLETSIEEINERLINQGI
uniref:Uncharacterized protein n=1 Tax=Fagus sylvatica TaxID=28930 RepID=A0A2N9EDD2_FAGSY